MFDEQIGQTNSLNLNEIEAGISIHNLTLLDNDKNKLGFVKMRIFKRQSDKHFAQSLNSKVNEEFSAGLIAKTLKTSGRNQRENLQDELNKKWHLENYVEPEAEVEEIKKDEDKTNLKDD